MKKLLVCSVAVLAFAGMAGAQLTEALPLATDANVVESPMLTIEGAVYMASDFTGFGARGTYKVMDELAVFGSVVSPEEGIGFSGGAIYALPLDLPVALAVRGSVGYWTDDPASAFNVNGALVASGDLGAIVAGLGWYANVGLNYVSYEVDTSHGTFSDTDAAFHVGGGATFAATEMISVFAGVDLISGDFIDETFIGGGVKVALGNM